MDFEQMDNQYPPPDAHEPIQDQSPQPAPIPVTIYTAPPKKRRFWRVFWWVIFALSITANVLLFLAIISMAAITVVGQKSNYNEHVIAKGDHANKIAVIRLEGIIDGQMSEEIREQINAARKDDNVKALIIRTITPGGGVSASDQIHHEILKFRRETKKPVVAFMQTIAASGGYYTSVACDRIVAEPTVITGSIGVIFNHLVLKELLEEKLGIVPVVIKSGPRKDWPSPFSETTEEQIEYLQEKLIGPAYRRFVGLVADGRPMLSVSDVNELADGSIYGATEALENQLIDRIGYINEAIAAAESLAGIEGAHVVEYKKPFSLSTILSSQSKSLWEIDRTALHELAAPQLLYLWQPTW